MWDVFPGVSGSVLTTFPEKGGALINSTLQTGYMRDRGVKSPAQVTQLLNRETHAGTWGSATGRSMYPVIRTELTRRVLLDGLQGPVVGLGMLTPGLQADVAAFPAQRCVQSGAHSL